MTSEAEQDLDDAAAWCEGERAGRGQKLVEWIWDCFGAICRTPGAFIPLRPPYRMAVVKGFKYIVVYHYDLGTDTVTVDKVFHGSRDPGDLLDGLP